MKSFLLNGRIRRKEKVGLVNRLSFFLVPTRKIDTLHSTYKHATLLLYFQGIGKTQWGHKNSIFFISDDNRRRR